MKYIYPAVFSPVEEGGYCVFFPDIKRGATQGDDMIEAMEMAEDFLCLALYDIEEEGDKIPIPSEIKSLELQPEDFASMVAADTDEYRRFNENKLIKKTLTIPSWLNARAEAASVNFSQTLQRALKEDLQLVD